MIERTLVVIKPDGVKRGLIGEIIRRFERPGLKLVGMKMVHIDRKFAEKHYSEDLIPLLGEKTKKSYEEHGIEFKETVEKRGKMVRDALLNYITEGPVIAFVLEGVHAVKNVRRVTGETGPSDSMPGTIRGDFAHMSIAYANLNEKMIKNIIHASGNQEDAKKEIRLWFKDKELHSYKTVHNDHVL